MMEKPSSTLWSDIRQAYDEWRATQQDAPLPPQAIDAFLAGWEAAQKKIAEEKRPNA